MKGSPFGRAGATGVPLSEQSRAFGVPVRRLRGKFLKKALSVTLSRATSPKGEASILVNLMTLNKFV